jgi:cytochrome c oxidase accessory protein FixG
MSSSPKVQLPLIDDEPVISSIAKDGSRNYVHPADVRGPFVRARYVVFAVLIAFWAVLPWVKMNGHPAVFLDIPARRFYLFGNSFNAQDFWLMFFVLTGIGFTLYTITTIFGRVWCGWACPQTVFLEGVYRRIERWIEGPRNKRIRRNAGPWNFDKLWRKAAKHALFIVASLVISHIFLSFFVSMPSLLQMVQSSPSEAPIAFTWMVATSAVFYFNFAWFREQLCVIICPYGRLQSTLYDKDTLLVGYDVARGEPRGKGKKRGPDAGDCVDCGRCVAVCPTGIDIRNGLQLDCVGCTSCIDACDEVMVKLKKEPGLVRYDSMNGFDGVKTSILRPRLFLYAAAITVWVFGTTLAFANRSTFEANFLRVQGAPFIVDDGDVQNLFTLHVVNKDTVPRRFVIEGVEHEDQTFTIAAAAIELEGGGDRQVPVFVRVPLDEYGPGQAASVRVQLLDAEGAVEEEEQLFGPLLGPRR